MNSFAEKYFQKNDLLFATFGCVCENINTTTKIYQESLMGLPREDIMPVSEFLYDEFLKIEKFAYVIVDYIQKIEVSNLIFTDSKFQEFVKLFKELQCNFGEETIYTSNCIICYICNLFYKFYIYLYVMKSNEKFDENLIIKYVLKMEENEREKYYLTTKDLILL